MPYDHQFNTFNSIVDVNKHEEKEGGKEERRERGRSQKFINLCRKFEGGEEKTSETGKSQSDKLDLQSEDTNTFHGVSSLNVKRHRSIKHFQVRGIFGSHL